MDYQFPSKANSKKPMGHQLKTFDFYMKNPRAFDLSEMGTGKTLSALWAMDYLMSMGKVQRVLVVCPLSTMQAVWGLHLFENFPHRTYRIAHGPYKAQILQGNQQITIINHDGVVRLEDEIIKWKPTLVIIDELTAFKTHTTDRSKAMARIAKTCKGCWGLTGEPTPNKPTEAYGQAKVVNPGNVYLPRYFKQFQAMVEAQVREYMWLPKKGCEKDVYKILQPAIRFERDQCVDIPECMMESRQVEFEPAQKRAYDDMRKTLIHEHEQGLITASNAGVKAMKLLQIASGSVRDENGNDIPIDSDARDKALLDIFEETGRKKLIVFSSFRASIQKVYELFKKHKISVEFINGSVDANVRARHIDAFQNGSLQVLVIQPQSSAHGITLTASAHIVWHSLIASGEIYNQANARITRAGQTQKQHIIHLLSCPAEERILKILQDKGVMSDGVLDLFTDI